MKGVENKIGAVKDTVMQKTGMGHSHATEVSAAGRHALDPGPSPKAVDPDALAAATVQTRRSDLSGVLTRLCARRRATRRGTRPARWATAVP